MMGVCPVIAGASRLNTSKATFIALSRRDQSTSKDLSGQSTAVTLHSSRVATVAIIALFPEPVGRITMRSLAHCRQVMTACLCPSLDHCAVGFCKSFRKVLRASVSEGMDIGLAIVAEGRGAGGAGGAGIWTAEGDGSRS